MPIVMSPAGMEQALQNNAPHGKTLAHTDGRKLFGLRSATSLGTRMWPGAVGAPPQTRPAKAEESEGRCTGFASVGRSRAAASGG